MPVAPGATQQELVFTLTNTGNGTETFNLTALSAGVVGDDFDPTLATPAIYFDTDDSGDLSAADVAYVPGTNDPVLAADATVRVLARQQHSDRASSTAIAVAASSRAALRPAFRRARHELRPARRRRRRRSGRHNGGDATLFGEYLVADVQLTAVKSQTIVDQFGGARALPGARINYQIVVTASGSGTATAAAFNDLIPANTTYVAGLARLNSATLSDAADGDAGEFTHQRPRPKCASTSAISRRRSGPQTIEFAVTIN